MLVPTFSRGFAIPPPVDMRPRRNAIDYERLPPDLVAHRRVYSPEASEVNETMGAIPAAVLARAGRVRGRHPLNSFTALGPAAERLASGQSPDDVYAPLRALVNEAGVVALIGVGLASMTLLHEAEGRAERRRFLRWANGPDGRPVAVETGSCSAGFGRLDVVLAAIERRAMVGASRWRVFPAREAVALAAAAIRADPEITRCDDAACARCADAIAGGPLV